MPVMFADDGILFSNNIEDITKFKDDPILKRVGIKLSNKVIDGKPSTGLINNQVIRDLVFVGCRLNIDEGMIYSPKGNCKIQESIFQISKIIWNGYENSSKPNKR